MRVIGVVLLLVVSLSASPPAGADGPAAVVLGRTLDVAGQPVSGVEVSLAGQKVLSAEDGVYRFENVPAPGRHRLECAMNGRKQPGGIVEVAPEAVVQADVTLRLSFFEEVTVSDLREEQSLRETPASIK